jgi:hypothetical protein
MRSISRTVKEVIRAAGLRDELTFTSLRDGGLTEAADADLTDAQIRAQERHKSANCRVCQADHEAGRRGGRQEGACYANRRPTFVRMTAARCQNGRPVNRSSHNTLKSLEQVKGIEPSSSAWKAPAAVPC